VTAGLSLPEIASIAPLEGKRCGDDGAGFELTIGAAADPARYAAWLVIVADVLAVLGFPPGSGGFSKEPTTPGGCHGREP
jgi:hypothetical protein